MKIRLTNDFHNTEAVVRPVMGMNGRHTISKDAARRAWKKLCGISGCQCSGKLGVRGRQHPVDKRFKCEFDEQEDGSFRVMFDYN